MALKNLPKMPDGLGPGPTTPTRIRTDDVEMLEDAKMMTILKQLQQKKAEESVVKQKREKKRELDNAYQNFHKVNLTKIKALKTKREQDVLKLREEVMEVKNIATEIQMRLDEFNIGMQSRAELRQNTIKRLCTEILALEEMHAGEYLIFTGLQFYTKTIPYNGHFNVDLIFFVLHPSDLLSDTPDLAAFQKETETVKMVVCVQ